MLDKPFFAVYNMKMYLCIMDNIASVRFAVLVQKPAGAQNEKKGTE